jgi:16S rRNA (cytosine967-C5)-methyltransferase
MTVYQMIYMDRIPTSVAVDEAVKIAKKQGDQRLSGFVNGVLRNFTRVTSGLLMRFQIQRKN